MQQHITAFKCHFNSFVMHFQVLEAARRGYSAHGIELNLWLVLYSRMRARSLGLSGAATFARQDLWKSDLSKYDDVVIFGVEQMVRLLKTAFPYGLIYNVVIFLMQMSLFISSLDKLQGIPIIFRCLIWRPSWTARCPLPPASPPAASPSPPGGRRPPWERELMQSGSTREKRKPDFFSICSQPDSCRIKKAAMPRSFAGIGVRLSCGHPLLGFMASFRGFL